MTHFMAYVILLSAGIGSVVAMLELLARGRTATRWLWVSSLGAILVVTGVATFAPNRDVRELPNSAAAPLALQASSEPLRQTVVPPSRAESIVRVTDSVLPAAWIAASVFLILAIVYGQRRLLRERRSSESRTMNGHEVLLTESSGPAVAGVGRPIVLLPRWVLALDTPSRELLLAHEFEHVKGGDTRLLLTGAVVTALMPWNPMVWWISRRLRLAVEQDCDARVLRTQPDVRRYADLLLMAASQPRVSARLLAAHFGEHRSDLDRRIRAMTDKTLKWRPLLAVAAAAAGLIVASCEAPRPEPLAPRPGRNTPTADNAVLTGSQVEKQATQAVGSVAPAYPSILREAGVEGEVLVSFIVNEQGNADVQSFKVLRATHELFATAVRKALPEMRFVAAEAGGRKVKQLVEQPFTFTIVGTKRSSAESSSSPSGALEEIAITGVPSRKRLAFAVRRNEREIPATPPNVVIYSIDGNELARGEDLLRQIEPQSIHSIEVYKPNRCPADMTCPLIKITLARGRTLGTSALMRPTQDENAREARMPEAEKRVAFRLNRSDILSTPMNFELLDSRGEVLARYGSRAEVRMVNSEDISASRTYSPKECAAMSGVACPLTRIWFKPGRESAYRKR